MWSRVGHHMMLLALERQSIVVGVCILLLYLLQKLRISARMEPSPIGAPHWRRRVDAINQRPPPVVALSPTKSVQDLRIEGTNGVALVVVVVVIIIMAVRTNQSVAVIGLLAGELYVIINQILAINVELIVLVVDHHRNHRALAHGNLGTASLVVLKLLVRMPLIQIMTICRELSQTISNLINHHSRRHLVAHHRLVGVKLRLVVRLARVGLAINVVLQVGAIVACVAARGGTRSVETFALVIQLQPVSLDACLQLVELASLLDSSPLT